MFLSQQLDEEEFIEKTISSVINQTILPLRWVIVSDGSTDRTDDIVRKYLNKFNFIKLIKLNSGDSRNFCSKVYAVREGYQAMEDVEFSHIGNLDADISLEANYFQEIMSRLEVDPNLGIAGGFIFENSKSRPGNSVTSVPGAIQFFRREAYDTFEGYMPLKHGGEDWYAEVMAKKNGWKVQAFPELKVFHHRITGASCKNAAQREFKEGRKDFTVGSHPLFEILKCSARIGHRPYILGSACRLSGFLYSLLTRERVLLSESAVSYLRKEQLRRILPRFLVRK